MIDTHLAPQVTDSGSATRATDTLAAEHKNCAREVVVRVRKKTLGRALCSRRASWRSSLGRDSGAASLKTAQTGLELQPLRNGMALLRHRVEPWRRSRRWPRGQSIRADGGRSERCRALRPAFSRPVQRAAGRGAVALSLLPTIPLPPSLPPPSLCVLARPAPLARTRLPSLASEGRPTYGPAPPPLLRSPPSAPAAPPPPPPAMSEEPKDLKYVEDGKAFIHPVGGEIEAGEGGNARLKRGLKARHICASLTTLPPLPRRGPYRAPRADLRASLVSSSSHDLHRRCHRYRPVPRNRRRARQRWPPRSAPRL